MSDNAEPTLPTGAKDDVLRQIFGADGLLSRALPTEGRAFEERNEQLEMAEAVARAASEKSHLLVEAGTGTGKSYAYLVPLILWAMENKKRVLIATHTKALQQQLVERDLPFLRDLFLRKMGSEFKFALCLGTQNYVCPRRLAKASVGGLFASLNDVDELKEITVFAGKSNSRTNAAPLMSPKPRCKPRRKAASPKLIAWTTCWSFSAWMSRRRNMHRNSRDEGKGTRDE